MARLPGMACAMQPRCRPFALCDRAISVLIYHSQGEAAIVGLARVASEPRPDENDPKSWVVDIAFVRKLAEPVTLREIKDNHRFDDWALVRQGRLSTMSVPQHVVAWLQERKIALEAGRHGIRQHGILVRQQQR